ncbi:MAG: hypothetical protein AAF798_02380 [Bacteroidota bacterium]
MPPNNFQLLAADEERHLSDHAIRQLQQSESNLTRRLQLFRMLGATIDLYSTRFSASLTSLMESVPTCVEASGKGMGYVFNEMTVDSSSPVYPWSYIALQLEEQEDEQTLIEQIGASIEDILIQLELPISAYFLVSVNLKKARAILRLEENKAVFILDAFRKGVVITPQVASIGWYDYEGGAFRFPMEDSLTSLTRSIKVLIANNKVGKAIDQALVYFKGKHDALYQHFLAQKIELAVVQQSGMPSAQIEVGMLKVERNIRHLLDRMTLS